jgi:hypothetical protein
MLIPLSIPKISLKSSAISAGSYIQAIAVAFMIIFLWMKSINAHNLACL